MKIKTLFLLLLVAALYACKGKSSSPITDQELSKAQKDLIR